MKLHNIRPVFLLLLCVAALAIQEDESNPVHLLRSRGQRSLLENDDNNEQGKTLLGPIFFIFYSAYAWSYIFIATLFTIPDNLPYLKAKLHCEYLSGTDCVCDEAGLIRAISNNEKAKMCQDTGIKLTKEIDITGKSFSLTCDPAFYEYKDESYDCGILGIGNRVITGAPSSAKFEKIQFSYGTSDIGGIASLTGGYTNFSECMFLRNNSTGNGGVLSIVGGKATLNKCIFSDNEALGNGGALSAIGASTVVEGIRCNVYGNTANNGGAFYVADGATVLLINSSVAGNKAMINGGGIFLRNGKISFDGNGRVGGDTAAGVYNSSIWVADDENPLTAGSALSCSPFIDVCGTIAELAEGQNNTQLFNNTNCVYNSTGDC